MSSASQLICAVVYTNKSTEAAQTDSSVISCVMQEVITEMKIKKVKDSLQKFPWFYRVDRSKAELILENYTSDGSFLVRECHHGGANVPFTLTIRFRGRLFHIQIRMRPDSRFALGTLKSNEMHFLSVAEMIDTYKKTPLQLHSNGKFFGETKLTHPPIVYSFSNKC
ncbi:B-cell linker protein [Orchesella cincta]|uniref:B-cell linker protein n=1 Tax=Orchesella cincta TaxID=48709 RepID=A0A1D2N2I0_ORCCI|nr:B-cell linker protein [Orchesella cincta]